MIKIGSTVLITTNNWFYAPNGRSYRGVFGTVKAVMDDEQTLGVKTNRNATNWYVEIGNMTIAGCQIFYAVECASPPPDEVKDFSEKEGDVKRYFRPSLIYNADAQT
jgi:hypothetical protein